MQEIQRYVCICGKNVEIIKTDVNVFSKPEFNDLENSRKFFVEQNIQFKHEDSSQHGNCFIIQAWIKQEMERMLKAHMAKIYDGIFPISQDLHG